MTHEIGRKASASDFHRQKPKTPLFGGASERRKKPRAVDQSVCRNLCMHGSVGKPKNGKSKRRESEQWGEAAKSGKRQVKRRLLSIAPQNVCLSRVGAFVPTSLLKPVEWRRLRRKRGKTQPPSAQTERKVSPQKRHLLKRWLPRYQKVKRTRC